MKKTILLLTTIIASYNSHAQLNGNYSNLTAQRIIINPANPVSGGRFLQMGSSVGLGQRLFNFGSSTTSTSFSFYNIDNSLRLSFTSAPTKTNIGMRDENGNEIFQIARTTTTGSFLHIPQSDSRLVIGAFGDYLLDEGHKFIIRNGNARIEGDIISTGKIGIGTNNPDAELTVNGEIHAKEITVDLNIPADYVFEKYYNGQSKLKEDYTMLTLNEVEAFTKKNNHLPSIPSAKEIKKNGLNVSEMTNLLLQKIEELTLYTIEQEKRINNLEKKLKNNKL